MWFWYRLDHQEIGPFGQEQLARLVQNPDPSDSLRAEDSTEWRCATEVLANRSPEPRSEETAAWDMAVAIATAMVRDVGWSLLPMEPPGLALVLGTHLTILVPGTALTADRVEKELAVWHQRLRAGEWKGVSILDLVYCVPTPLSAELNALRKKRKVAFTGGGQVRSDFANPGPLPTTLGALDRESSSAVARGVKQWGSGEPVDGRLLLKALADSHRSHGQLEARLSEVKSWGSMATLAVCLAVFGWGTAAGGTENTLNLLRFGANFYPLTVEQGEWWRLWSCTFLHIGVVHLACNMITLFSVATKAEQVYGNARFLALYALSGLAGSLASVFTGDSVSAGASGALFGVCGAIAVLGWRYREQWPPAFRRSLFQGMMPMIGYNLLYGFSNSGIDNAAHLGGLVAGAAFALAVRPQALDQTTPSRTPERAMLLLGLLPFLAQTWTVPKILGRPDLASYPKRIYTDPTGTLEVPLPSLFRWKTAEGETFLQGPGLVVLLTKLDEANEVVIDNPAFQESLQKAEGTTSVKVEAVAGRTWALRDSSQGGVKFYQAFAFLGTTLAKVEVAVGQGSEKAGLDLRSTAIQGLRVKGSDAAKLGVELSDQGLHTRALQELEGVPETPETAEAKVTSLLALSLFDEAQAELDRLLKTSPESPKLWRLRSELEVEKENLPAAWQAYAKSETLEKDLQEKYHRMVDGAGLLQKLGRSAEAEALYAKARAGFDQKAHIESDIWNKKAWILVRSKRYKEALPLAEKAVKAEENRATLDTRGRAFLELGQYDKAKADFDKVLNQDFNQPYANYAYARILDHEGDQEKARFFYSRYLSLAGGKGEFTADVLKRIGGP